MNRRSFIRVLGLGAAATTLPAVWPEGTAPAIVEAAGPKIIKMPWICSGVMSSDQARELHSLIEVLERDRTEYLIL